MSGDVSDRTQRRQLLKGLGSAGLVALAGCSGDGGGGTPTGGKAGSPGGGKKVVNFAADPTVKGAWDKLKPVLYDVGLSKDIEVNVIAGAWATGKRQDKYQQWLAAGRDTPDLFMMDNGWTIPFIQRKQILNLSQALSNEFVNRVKNDYFQAMVKTALDPESGDLYGVPLFIDLPTIQYRKDLVKEAGYDPEGNNWATESMRWDRFAKVTKDTKKQAGKKFGFTFQAKAYSGLACCDFLEFMSSWGGAYFGGLKNAFGPIGKRPITVDNQSVVDAIRMVRTFINGKSDPHGLDKYAGNIAPKAVLQWTEEPSRKPFTNGHAVMHRNWPYSININGAKDVFGKDLGVMPIPYSVTESKSKYQRRGGPVAALGGWNLTVNPNAAQKEAALEVIRAIASRKFRLKMFEAIGFTPPIPKLLETKRAKNVPIMGRYIEQLKIAGKNAIPRPVTVVWPQESTAIASKVNTTLGKGAPPAKAMSSLKQQLSQIEKTV